VTEEEGSRSRGVKRAEEDEGVEDKDVVGTAKEELRV
jgi:hypothetical protein